MKITHAYFDLGKVLLDWDKMIACRRLVEHGGKRAPQEIHDYFAGSDAERTLELGNMSAEDFALRVINYSGTSFSVPEVINIWGSIFTPNPDIEPFIDRLIAKKARFGVISDTSEIHWNIAARTPIVERLRRYGARFVRSYTSQMSKSGGPGIFLEAIRLAGVKPELMLYLDDVKKHVVTAQECGIRAFQYDCTRDRPERLNIIAQELGF